MRNTSPLEDVVTEQVAHLLLLLQRQGKVTLYTHIANETPNRLRAYRNARLGLSSGVPDMLILYPHCALFLELKREKASYLSDTQKVWITKLNEIGYPIYARVARGYKEAEEIIKYYAEGGK